MVRLVCMWQIDRKAQKLNRAKVDVEIETMIKFVCLLPETW